MRKIIIITIIVLSFITNQYNAEAFYKNAPVEEAAALNYVNTMKRDLLCLMLGYPEYAVDVKREDNGNVYLIMKSGKKILYDDKKNKTFEQKLNNPDLQDMMEQIYPLKPVTDLMEKDFDPGRIRVYELLREVYGGSKQAVEKNLVNVSYINCRFNGNNKAAESLKNVMKELVPLAKQKRDIGVCVYPLSGTYNYRTIAGTGRLSPHAFGNTIDLARDKRDYWRWTSPEQGRKRLLSYPKDIVEIFEKNNFVWGGKWNHFDILHFEYRPEIILKAKFFGDNNNNNKWYSGAPIEELSVKSIIEKIDKAFN